MTKFYYIFLVFIFALTVFSQSPGKMSEQEKKRKLLIARIDRTEDKDSVLGILQKFNAELKKERQLGETVEGNAYSICIARMKIWLKYRWFIADTGLSKKWLRSVLELVEYMYKTKKFIDTSKYNRSTENGKYRKAVEYFDVAYSRFVKLVKKPVKVSGKSVRKAKIKKVLWQRSMRKKYKIKDNIQEDIP